MNTRARHYSARAHEVSQRHAVDRLLDRANAEGRTRVRCRHCAQPIERAKWHELHAPRWKVDDDSTLEASFVCTAAPVEGPIWHEPAE